MPSVAVARHFSFDAAHQLTNYYGKCEQLHGHTYQLEVVLEGELQDNGMVIDFVLLKRIVNKHVIDRLDHKYLNDIVENPSAERLAVWIWDRLKDLSRLLKEELNDPNLPEELKKFLEQNEPNTSELQSQFQQKLRLQEVKLWESPDTWASYRG